MHLRQPVSRTRERMIDCYTWTTDNGYKPRMMLEETGLPHKVIPVNIREKAQMKPEFLKISPGHKIPAIVDHDGPGGATVTLCEFGAIFKYLAEKSWPILSERRRCPREGRPVAVLRLGDVHHALATVRDLGGAQYREGARRDEALRHRAA